LALPLERGIIKESGIIDRRAAHGGPLGWRRRVLRMRCHGPVQRIRE
jgi:hypothetical protein